MKNSKRLTNIILVLIVAAVAAAVLACGSDPEPDPCILPHWAMAYRLPPRYGNDPESQPERLPAAACYGLTESAPNGHDRL